MQTITNYVLLLRDALHDEASALNPYLTPRGSGLWQTGVFCRPQKASSGAHPFCPPTDTRHHPLLHFSTVASDLGRMMALTGASRDGRWRSSMREPAGLRTVRGLASR